MSEGLGGNIPIIPFTDAQWVELERVKAKGTEWFGYIWRDGRWVRVDEKP